MNRQGTTKTNAIQRTSSVCLLLWVAGCTAMPPMGLSQPMIANPTFVRANNSEEAWERTVDVVHDYLFDIERENRLAGTIETEYKTGANVLEPWHRDAVGLRNRLEGTLQSIRRKAFISVTPANGGFLVGVEAHKELEDVARAATSVGGATFLDNSPLDRDLNAATGQSTPSGWIPKGRDTELEDAMLRSLTQAFGQR